MLSMLTGRIVDASCLPAADRQRWRAWIRADIALDAPAFDPEFVCELARHISECKIGVLEQGGEVVGYVPFRENENSRGPGPIVMCDYQVVALAPEISLDARQIVQALNLKSLMLECVHSRNFAIADMHGPTLSKSPRVDLRSGYRTYVEQLAQLAISGKNVRNKLRRLERDHGHVSFQHDVRSRDALEHLLTLKAARYTSGGVFQPWVYRALEAFHGQRHGEVEGHLSVLLAGSSEVAYLFCLKRGGLLYYWFPTFNPAFGKYSPGLVALWLLIRDLPSLGCDRLDLGPGGEEYKNAFANVYVPVASARIEASGTVAAARRLWADTRQRISENKAARAYLRPLIRRLRGDR